MENFNALKIFEFISEYQKICKKRMDCLSHLYLFQIIFTIAAFCFATIAIVFIFLSPKNTYETTIQNTTITLPPSFFIDSLFDTPVKNIGKRRTSTIFSFISLMQSLWRKNSDQGSKSYISFSEQAFGKAISDLCKEPDHSSLCTLIQGQYSTEDIPLILLPQLIEDIPALKKALFPESMCSYNSDPSLESQCQETNSLPYATNPLSFHIQNLTYARSVSEIKELFYNTEEPLLLSLPEPYAKIYNPCKTGDTECESAQIHCPYNRTKYCSIDSFPAITGDGAFFIPQYLEPYKPITFMIVGYDDDYIPPRGLADLQEMEFPRGGFIVKGLQRDMGYSIYHYTGQLIPSDSYYTCYNTHNPISWGSPEVQCIREKKYINLCPASTPKPTTTNVQNSKEEMNSQHIYGYNSKENSKEEHSAKNSISANALICVDEKYCEVGENITYSLSQLPIRTHDLYIFEDPKTGRTVIPLFKYENDQMVEEIHFTKLPLWLLGNAFELLNQDLYSQWVGKPSCGYWFIPYELISRISSMSLNKFNEVIALHLNVDFSTSRVKDIQKTMSKDILDDAPDRPVTQYPFDF